MNSFLISFLIPGRANPWASTPVRYKDGGTHWNLQARVCLDGDRLRIVTTDGRAMVETVAEDGVLQRLEDGEVIGLFPKGWTADSSVAISVSRADLETAWGRAGKRARRVELVVEEKLGGVWRIARVRVIHPTSGTSTEVAEMRDGSDFPQIDSPKLRKNFPDKEVATSHSFRLNAELLRTLLTSVDAKAEGGEVEVTVSTNREGAPVLLEVTDGYDGARSARALAAIMPIVREGK